MEQYYLYGVDHFFKGESSEKAFSMMTVAGDKLYISGQSGFDFDGNFHGEGDPGAQADQACKNILRLLEENGFPKSSLCRMRVCVTDRENRKAVYSAIGENFGDVSVCSTGLTVKALPLPEMLMQIDIEAHKEL